MRWKNSRLATLVRAADRRPSPARREVVGWPPIPPATVNFLRIAAIEIASELGGAMTGKTEGRKTAGDG